MKRVTIDGRHVNVRWYNNSLYYRKIRMIERTFNDWQDLFTVEEEGGKMKLIQKEIWGNNRSCEAVMVHEFDGDDWNMVYKIILNKFKFL
jgi:hypothetical protein